MVMSNQRALDEMLSLWQRYQDNPNMEFNDRKLSDFTIVYHPISREVYQAERERRVG